MVDVEYTKYAGKPHPPYSDGQLAISDFHYFITYRRDVVDNDR